MRLLWILIACTEPAPRLIAPVVVEQKELLPDPRLDWLVIGEGNFRRPALLAELDEKWRREHDVVRIYGWRNGECVLLMQDGSERYDKVALGVRLLTAAGDDELRNVAAPYLVQFAEDAAARLRKAGAVEVKTPATPAEGASASVKLQELFIANGSEIQLRLLSPEQKPFPGPKVLDVLSSLGLMSDFAGFSVKTRTPPGKLERQALLDGKMNPTNLVFEMYVPHVASAPEAFELMQKAEAYAARRLGGRTEVLIETFGRPEKADVPAAKKRVDEVARALSAAGFAPGSPAAKRLFQMP